MKKKCVDESATILSQLMMPTDANNMGFVHGGNLLRLIDQTAGVCAMKHAGKTCVTASIDRVHFLKPIKLGEVVTLKASVNFVGRTSMEIGVRVEAEDLKTGKKRHTNACYLTFVSVGKEGKPSKVPDLICDTTEQKRRCKEAGERRVEKLKSLKSYKKDMRGEE
tara:strand:+ start:824 stop:1318 length:495 start_codon:yes stop_codon:yes gene_type:complete